MKVQCINRNCQTVFEVNEQRLPQDRPKKLRCAYCKTVFYVERTAERSAAEEIMDADCTMLLNLSNRNRENEPPSFEQFVIQKRTARRPTILPVASDDPFTADPPSFRPDAVQDLPPPPAMEHEERLGLPAPAHEPQVFQRVTASIPKKADMLQKIQWLSDLSNEDYQEFAQYWEVFFGHALSPLFKPGERNSFFTIIYSGEVALYHSREEYEKKSRPILQLGRGGCLGEQAIFRVYPRNLFAMVEKDAYLLLLTRKQAREMSQRHPHLWQAMANKLLLQLSEIVAQMVSPEQLEVFSVMSRALTEKR